MKLTPEDLDKLRTKQLANIIRKLGEGKTITAREQRLLDESRSTPAAEESGPNFVQTWEELARALTQRIGVSVSRKSLQNWRNPRLRPELEDKWPRDRADGRKDVSTWVKFVVDNGLNRADEILEDDKSGGERKSVRDWKMFREELQCNDLERKIARGDGLLLVAADLEVPMGSTFVAINAKLQQFPARSARFLVMCRDEVTAEAKLRDEMDAVLKDLNAAEYIDASIDDVIKDFPFDDETAALYAKVSFDGHDRAGFVELIRRAVEETLRRIGQRSLDSAHPEEEPPPESRPAGSQDKAKSHDPPAAPLSEPDRIVRKPSRKRQPVTRRRKRGGKRAGSKR